jgi:hypothetical protein
LSGVHDVGVGIQIGFQCGSEGADGANVGDCEITPACVFEFIVIEPGGLTYTQKKGEKKRKKKKRERERERRHEVFVFLMPFEDVPRYPCMKKKMTLTNFKFGN